eukprot:CAMPEP_0117653514 /NCGR_PEP_ID=MMETSP0804-20121206/3233_1 /TAXON_ID=1074897 /ORGANISM="Tetraselmis astigmatica, Strain CCMP880" /LENGTH=76 /DNA_ID=CAMNT_0005459697 /DNA_START=444 /DNA_END=674 /DNA_ORIENTATION=+
MAFLGLWVLRRCQDILQFLGKNLSPHACHLRNAWFLGQVPVDDLFLSPLSSTSRTDALAAAHTLFGPAQQGPGLLG